MKMGNIFDLLKLILSLLVISIHVNPLGSKLWYLRHPIVRIAVPLFFIMSSYFFFKKINKQELKDQLKSLTYFIKRNLILYISWFIVLWAISYDLWGKRFTLEQLFFEIVNRFIFSSTFKSSWYLMALVLGVIIIYFLTKYINNKVGIIIGLISYCICAMLSNYKMLFIDVEWLQVIQQSYPYTICYSFPVGLIFIMLGKILAEKEIIVTKKTYIKLLMSTVLLFVETYLVIVNKWYGETPCYLMLIPFCYYLFMILSKIDISIPYGKEIRVISTIVYCFHYSFRYMINDLLINMGWDMKIFPYSLYIYMIVVIVSVIVALCIYKCSQKWGILKNLY